MREDAHRKEALMIRALTIVAAVVALAVSAAPVASAGPEWERTESISFTFKAGPPKQPRAMVTRSGGELLSDFAKSKPAGVYDHGLTQVRPELMEDALKAARKPPPRGTTGVVTNNNDPDKLGKVHAGGARVIEVPSVNYTAVNAMFLPWDMASKAPPKPRGIVVSKDLDCDSTPFMDYTDDSCMAKSRAAWVKARPKPPRGMLTPSGGETLSNDWVKAPPKPPRLGTRPGGSAPMRLAEITDGTSNTLLLGEGLVGQMERGKGGRVSPPKSPAIHENEGIDGGFKAKPPHKPRLVSHEDNDQF